MTDNHDTYIPVGCGTHSEYELAIMHRVMLQLTWRDIEGQAHIGRFMPLDLKTEQHQEFLIAQSNDGVMHQIRLDKIEQSDVEQATQV